MNLWFCYNTHMCFDFGHFKSVIVFCALLIAQAGCDIHKKPGVYVDSNNQKLIREFGPSDVIFKANGVKICKSDYDIFQKLNEKVYRIAKKYPLSGRCEDAERFTVSTEQGVPSLLLKMELTRQAAIRYGIQLGEAAISSAWEEFAKNIGREGRSLNEVVDEIGLPVAKLLSDMINSELYTSKLVELPEFGNDFTVSEAEVDQRMKFVEDFSSRAEENNEKARKVLLEARKRILGGEKFAAVAKELSEVRPNDGKEWQTLMLGELADGPQGQVNQLKKWLQTAKVGDISGPMEMDDGISIVGVVAIFDGEVPKGMKSQPNYQLVRCTRYYREKAIAHDRKETRKLLVKEKRHLAIGRLGEKLFNESVIEFPHGTNFYANAEESAKWWQEEFKRRKF